MTTSEEIENFFQVAKASALEAGEVIKRNIDKPKDERIKSCETDLVTKYDEEVERSLIAMLSKEFPDHKFIAEETCSDDGRISQLTDTPTWIIDPIDGTTNFTHSFPQICISIGLAINKNIEIGIIYNPCYNEMYTAKRGQGAFLNEIPIRTSPVKELKKSLANFETWLLANAPYKDIALARFEAFIDMTRGVRTIGSAALTLAYIARGATDVYQIDGLKPWDIAAGFLIVTEAGGTVIDTKGGPFNFMLPRLVAASTEALAIETSQLMIKTDLKTQRGRLFKKRLDS